MCPRGSQYNTEHLGFAWIFTKINMGPAEAEIKLFGTLKKLFN